MEEQKENFDIKAFFAELRPRAAGSLAATVANVKASCQRLVSAPDCPLEIDLVRLADFVERLDLQRLRCASHLMETRAQLPDLPAQVSFHISLHLFNFAHGYRHALHRVCGRGAWQTMQAGLEALQADCPAGLIDAAALASLSEAAVDRCFALRDAAELVPLRIMISAVARASAQRLRELDCRSFHEFVCRQRLTDQEGRPSACALVQALADNFPAFDDRRRLPDGSEVLFLKKAQLAVAELFQRLAPTCPELFGFSDIENFTVACDNVLPCVLRKLGIIRIDPDLERRIDQRQALPAGLEEAQLRAAGISAAEMMLQTGAGRFWAKQLGDYLWTLGKAPGFRELERHATPDTCFY